MADEDKPRRVELRYIHRDGRSKPMVEQEVQHEDPVEVSGVYEVDHLTRSRSFVRGDQRKPKRKPLILRVLPRRIREDDRCEMALKIVMYAFLLAIAGTIPHGIEILKELAHVLHGGGSP